MRTSDLLAQVRSYKKETESKQAGVLNEEVELDEGAFWGQDKMVKAFKDADKKKGLVRMVKVDGNLTSTMTVKAREIKKWEKKGFKLDPYFDDMREEVELDEAKFQVNYSKGGKLFSKTVNAKNEDDAEEKAIKQFKIDDDDIRSVVKESLDEAIKYTHAAVDKKGLVIGFASKESDAKDMARREKGRVVTLTKPLPDNKKSDMMINRPLPDGMDKFPTNTSATQGKRMEEDELDEIAPALVAIGRAAAAGAASSAVDNLMSRKIDPADLDLDATDADKKAADKNIIMQMRKAMDVRGNMPIEFADGKKEKVDPKILDMMTKAHMKIQKPRDKEKFVAMISKSKRDMLNVAKKISSLKMGEELELDEKFQSRRPSSKEVKMAIGIANDPRYKQGNMTGAVKAIEKIRDGLSKYPEVADALRKANENLEEGKMKDLLIKAQDLMGPSKNREQGIEFVMKGLKVSKKEATKLVDAVIKMSENLDEAMSGKDVAKRMMKIQTMKSFASKVAKMKTVSRDDLEKMLPDYIDGADITKVLKEEDELDEKVEYVEYKFKNERDAKAAKAYFDGIQLMSFDVNDDNIRGGELMVDAGSKDMTKYHKEVMKKFKPKVMTQESLEEKYDLYHKTFSDAMQHAYDYAKKKLGITVDPKEIDSKVATGPKKPSEGKTNKYRLKGKGGNLQIQVYNKGGSKPFELNMYKEENEMIKSLKDTILEMWTEASDKKDEGNAFGAALQAARENGDETFVVAGKTYKCEDYDENGEMKEFVQSDGTKKRVKEGDNRLKANRTETNKNDKSDDGDGLDAVQPKAVKKKFKDRKDKDIDNDGDVDDSDKFLHKRRKAVSKAVKGESIERYHETKKGSLRDAVLQMWGEKHTPDHEEEKNEKKTLTKEKKDGSVKKMTDTGKEVTPVETSVKMPKIKETNNKV